MAGIVNDALRPFALGTNADHKLLLLLLATPAYTAGAIPDEKTRGTLQYLLAADLTAWEILAGKLLGRIAQVALLALAALPLICTAR